MVFVVVVAADVLFAFACVVGAEVAGSSVILTVAGDTCRLQALSVAIKIANALGFNLLIIFAFLYPAIILKDSEP